MTGESDTENDAGINIKSKESTLKMIKAFRWDAFSLSMAESFLNGPCIAIQYLLKINKLKIN